jgi:hypothetical protein
MDSKRAAHHAVAFVKDVELTDHTSKVAAQAVVVQVHQCLDHLVTMPYTSVLSTWLNANLVLKLLR